MEGWIKLHRKLLDWEWYDDANVCRLFLHLLLKASHQETVWKGVVIKPGDVVIGRTSLAKETGLSEQSVRTCLSKLKSTREITSKSTSKYTIISINNYSSHQQINQQTNKPSTSNQPAINHIQEYKNDNNVKNNKIYIAPDLKDEDFEHIVKKYNVPMAFVLSKYDDLLLWASSRPNNSKLKGRNWRMTLMKFVKDDMLKIKFKENERTNKVSVVRTD